MAAQATLTCAALGAGTIILDEVEVVEEIGAPVRATVDLRVDVALDGSTLIGEPATLKWSIDSSSERSFAFVVTAVELPAHELSTYRAILTLEHPITLLRYRRDHRTFLEKSVHDIVDAVLLPVDVKADWKATRGGTARLVCAQYGETDYDFLMRILAEEGIFWFCPDTTSAAGIRVADASSGFDEVTVSSEIPFSGEGQGMGIHQLTVEHIVTSGAVALADYDYEKPGVDLTARATLDDEPAGEVFEYPGRYSTQADGVAIAKIRAEEIASTKVRIEGVSDRAQLAAGAWFVVTTATGRRLPTETGKLLVRQVVHRLVAQSLTPYSNRFVASPFELPYRPRRAARPTVEGGLSAVATGPTGQEIHTDKFGRTKLLYSFDRLGKKDETSSQWVRVLQPAIGGSMMLARIGWELAVRHLDGDPDRPLVVARMYDGEHLAPETLPGTQTKTSFDTLTSPRAEKINAITIDDKGGAMSTDITAAKDLDATILHDETEKIGNNDTVTIDVDRTVLIGNNQTIKVEKDDTIKALKDAGVAVAGNRKKSVTKDETVTVDGGVSTRVDGNDEETVGANLDVKADEEIIETAKGTYDLTVGAAVTAKTGKDYTYYVAGNSTETVGAAKTVQSSDGSLTESVQGNSTLTVGGAWAETVSGNRSSSSQGAMARTVGAVGSVTATGKLQLKGKTVKITIGAAGTFLGGGGIVSLTPASATFIGLVTLSGSGGVEISGNPHAAV